MNKLAMESTNIVQGNIDKIGNLFPNVIVESENGKTIDFDILKQELSNDIVEGNKERYQLTWPGKKETIKNANTSTKKTLRPLKDKSVDFDNTENIYIEGDNLEVLKILQESYLNKIKCIYIDPPYNRGSDLIYKDNYHCNVNNELVNSGQIDEYGNRLISNNQSNGRFHSDWLSMMYPRLKLARNLLTSDGVIFISIDDNEQSNLKKICDEIFGESNFVSQLIWKSKSGGANDSKYIANDHEYILAYAKNISLLKFNLDKDATVTSVYNFTDDDGRKYGLDRLDKQSLGYIESLDFPIIGPDGKEYVVQHKNPNNKVARWRWGKDTVKERYDELVFKYPYVYTKNYEKDGTIPRSLMIDERFGRTRTGKTDFKSLFDDIALFDFPKPVDLIAYLIDISTSKDDIVLDFFSGSATTAHSLLKCNSVSHANNKFILVQLPEHTDSKSTAYKNGYNNLCDIGEERIRRAAKKIKEETNADIDYGFRVYKVDSSNMKDVYYKPGEISQTNLFDYMSNIKEDRTPLDLLIQVMLDLGLTLDLKIEERNILNNNVYFVENNALIACFDDNVNIDIIDEICKYNPLKVVFKDSSFRTDKDKINLEERIKKLSPETEISIL